MQAALHGRDCSDSALLELLLTKFFFSFPFFSFQFSFLSADDKRVPETSKPKSEIRDPTEPNITSLLQDVFFFFSFFFNVRQYMDLND